MSVDKLVDSTQLDSDLTSVADAIRAKSGGSSQLAFPAGFVSEIQAIPSGGDIAYYSTKGICYIENMNPPTMNLLFNATGLFEGASEMKSFTTDYSGQIGGGTSFKINEWFKNCTKLETVHFPNVTAIKGTYTDRPFMGCTKLKDFTVGSIGNPVTEFKTSTSGSYKFFYNLSQSTLVITIFVSANSLADISTDITAQSPWGATNATIIYKSSVDGSVLT